MISIFTFYIIDPWKGFGILIFSIMSTTNCIININASMDILTGGNPYAVFYNHTKLLIFHKDIIQTYK